MSRTTFEQLRLPTAFVLLSVAAFFLWPRPGEVDSTVTAAATPSSVVIVGEPGGEVVAPTEQPTVAPATLAPTPAPTQSATSTPAPVAEDGFSARVLVCRAISGSSCQDQVSSLAANAGSFTALVLFTDADGGDTINAVLSGPAGTIPGGAYTLQGGGDGYYYSTFPAGSLPSGDYTLTALRNGEPVATASFSKSNS